MVYYSLSFFHKGTAGEGKSSLAFACKAVFHALPNGATRIIIRNPPMTGVLNVMHFSHAMLWFPLQPHPFTISSIPSDGYMEFVNKAQSGGTSRFFRYGSSLGHCGWCIRSDETTREIRHSCLAGGRQRCVVLHAPATPAHVPPILTLPPVRSDSSGESRVEDKSNGLRKRWHRRRTQECRHPCR